MRLTHIKFGIKGNDIKGNSSVIMVLKASLQEYTHNKYVGYIKPWIVCTNTGNKDIDRGVTYSPINSAKCVVVTVFIFEPFHLKINIHSLRTIKLEYLTLDQLNPN